MQIPSESIVSSPRDARNQLASVSSNSALGNLTPARCRQLLEETRQQAVKDRGYSSADTRKRMTNEIQARCEGKIPYDWQLDIAEAVYLGLDSVIVAGTGAGKTLPFAMALLADVTAKSKIIIVSTLNELEHDQVRQPEVFSW